MKTLITKTLSPLLRSKIESMTEDDLIKVIDIAKKAIAFLEAEDIKDVIH
jgi:DNA-binding XRE family transcriptional regulator